MDADRLRMLGPLLDRALDMEPDERAAWLAELRTSSASVADELQLLLSEEERADERRFLFAPPVRPPSTTLIGRRFNDKYDIERELGRGGMATVYVARDVRHRRTVAVKVLRPELSAALGSERFRREIELTAVLQHPHILPLFDSGSADGHLYYVMPFVDGETLRARLVREGRLAIDDAIRLATEVAEALAYAHDHGIVHRDVKPENILLQGDHALVADFGVAVALENAAGERVTRPGVSVGTPLYMAPEQVMDQTVDGRADVYALGVVLHELIAGVPPFSGPSAKQVLAQALTSEPSSLSAVRPDVPPHVAAAVRKALSRDSNDRFATASDFAAALATPSTANRGVPPAVHHTARWRTRRALALTAALIVVGIGLVVGLRIAGLRSWFASAGATAVRAGADQRALAVLPFENVGGQAADEYFSDGLTEELIAALSELRSLRVAARTSSFAFKGQTRDVREIARALNVGAVLVGSVRARDNRIRVTAQLVDAATGLDLWSGTYDERKLADVFDIQSDLARRIAGALDANLSPSERGRITRRPTESIEAYTLYLKGRFAWAQRDEGLLTAVDYFKQAIALDTQYARAYAGLASAYPPLAVHGYIDPREARPLARDAANRAVALDDSLAEAHTALAGYLHVFEWDWAGAEREYRRAIALDPNEPTAHLWYGLLLEQVGRFDEAIVERRRAVELDPLAANAGLASALRRAGRFDEARAAYHDVIDHHPGYWQAHDGFGRLLEDSGSIAEAIPEFERAAALAGRTTEPAAGLARVLALSGRRADARKLVEKLRGDAARTGIFHPVVATALAALGDTDAAMQWLEISHRQRNPGLVEIGQDPRYAALRGDARFQSLLESVGLRR